jgi:hypothetical protein
MEASNNDASKNINRDDLMTRLFLLQLSDELRRIWNKHNCACTSCVNGNAALWKLIYRIEMVIKR